MVREYLEAILIALLFLRFANTFVIQTFYIPSSSMEKTLLVGDHLFVNRFVYGEASALERALLPAREVRRGDIVIFRSPEDPKLDVVKRCVAVAGDVVEIEGRRLTINGEPVDESGYARFTAPARASPNEPGPAGLRDHLPPFRVPPDNLFCLGDNRDNSYDSRYWGPLPTRLVKGRAVVVYWSWGGETSDGSPAGLFATLRRFAATVVGLIPDTRWGRSFHIIR